MILLCERDVSLVSPEFSRLPFCEIYSLFAFDPLLSMIDDPMLYGAVCKITTHSCQESSVHHTLSFSFFVWKCFIHVLSYKHETSAQFVGCSI